MALAGYPTPQELQNASADSKTISKFGSDPVGMPNINRVGNDVENMMTIRQRMLELAADVANRKVYLTQADMLADTSQPLKTTARVETGVGAGDYVWNGVAWGFSDVQGATVPRVNSLLRVAQSCPWLDASVFDLSGAGQANWFVPAQMRVEGALAIKSVRLENEDKNERYAIAVFANQDAGHRDRIAIARASDGVIVLNTGAIDIVRNPTGLTRVVIGDTQNDASIRAILDIDYRQITSTGVLHTGNPGVYWIARTREADVWMQMAEKAMLPAWVRADYRNAVLGSSDRWRTAASAIRGVWLKGALGNKDYRITVVAKDHPTSGCRIFVGDGTGTVASYQTMIGAPQGIQTVPLSESGGSGISGYATVNWSLITSAFVISNPLSNLVIDPTYPDTERAAQIVREQEGRPAGTEATVRPLPRAIRASFPGDSVPWGGGYLGVYSWVGIVEEYMRTRLATSLHASSLAPSATLIASPNLWRGEARRISGFGASTEFDLWGDEVTINLCRERGNAGAALVDLFVDGTLFGSFSTYNDEPAGVATDNFVGNTVVTKFELSRPFTYDHEVTVGGQTMVGGMNTQGSGASIPAGWDYMVVRDYSEARGIVVHTLWFRSAPSGAFACTYKYGESIAYMRGTLGNTGKGIDTPLESPFGDGSVSEDTSNPGSVSSGLGYRESDERACKTFILGEQKQRHFKLTVRALDPRATGGTPWLDLNFVTNRMHHIQNAGIGGWSADLFLNSTIWNNRIERVAEYRPDFVLFMSSTNDDFTAATTTHVSKGWVTRTGLTAQQLKDDESSNYFNAITGAPSNKTVQDNRIPILAVTAKSITLDMTNATVNAEPGDAITIGSFHGDHRRVTSRLIDTYENGVITFKRPINAADFSQAETLDDLVGETVMLKGAPSWISNVKRCVEIITDQNPDCRIHIATAGAPNFHHRRLFGYRELGMALAREMGWGFVDFYDATNLFTYSQPQTGRLYIGPGSSTTSTGAASYALVTSSGATPTFRMIHNLRVLINGVDRTNRGIHIEGGYAYSWASGVADPTLSNRTLQQKSYRLVIEDDIAPEGAVIEIFYSPRVWSTDDTHPGRIAPADSGLSVFGVAAQQIVDALAGVVL